MGLLRLNGALGPKIMTAQDFDAIPVLNTKQFFSTGALYTLCPFLSVKNLRKKKSENDFSNNLTPTYCYVRSKKKKKLN